MLRQALEESLLLELVAVRHEFDEEVSQATIAFELDLSKLTFLELRQAFVVYLETGLNLLVHRLECGFCLHVLRPEIIFHKKFDDAEDLLLLDLLQYARSVDHFFGHLSLLYFAVELSDRRLPELLVETCLDSERQKLQIEVFSDHDLLLQLQ